MKKTKKENWKTQPVKKSVKLKSAKYVELQAEAEAERINALHEQNVNATKQKKVNYEDLKLALVKVSEQMKRFLAENVGDYRIRRVYKVNYDIERLIKGF